MLFDGRACLALLLLICIVAGVAQVNPIVGPAILAEDFSSDVNSLEQPFSAQNDLAGSAPVPEKQFHKPSSKRRSLSRLLNTPRRLLNTHIHSSQTQALSHDAKVGKLASLLGDCENYSARNHIKVLLQPENGLDINLVRVNSGVSALSFVASFSPKCTRVLLKHGANPNLVVNNRVAIIEATKECPECLEVLLNHPDTDVNFIAPDSSNTYPTALIAATAACDLQATEMLLSHGADIAIESSYHCSALFSAIGCDYPLDSLPVIQQLVEAGADLTQSCKRTSRTPLSFAAEQCNQQLTRFLAQKTPAQTVVEGEIAPVFLAAKCEEHKAMDLIRELLGDGRSVNDEYPSPNPPTLLIGVSQDKELLHLLPFVLELPGLDRNAVSQGSLTPLIALTLQSYDDPEIFTGAIEDLLEGGDVDVDLEPETPLPNTETALIAATRLKSLEVLKLLLQHKANPNYVAKNNNYALRTAIIYNCLGCIEVLNKAGVDLNTPRPSLRVGHAAIVESPPLFIAISIGYPRMIKTLIGNGAKVKSVNHAGQSPISVLLDSHKSRSIVKAMAETLINAGAKVTVADLEKARTTADVSVIGILIQSKVPLMKDDPDSGVYTPFLEKLVQEKQFRVLNYIKNISKVKKAFTIESPVSGKTIPELLAEAGLNLDLDVKSVMQASKIRRESQKLPRLQ